MNKFIQSEEKNEFNELKKKKIKNCCNRLWNIWFIGSLVII